MSTKNKPDTSAEKKKKVSFFSFRNRLKGNTIGGIGTSQATPAEIDPSVAAQALLVPSTTDEATSVDKPTTSKKGATQKVTKFFRKSIKKARSKSPKKQQKEPSNSEQDAPSSLALANQLIEKAITDVIPDSSDEQRQRAAIRIQAMFRGTKDRRKFTAERKNIVKVEALARGFLSRKRAADMKKNMTAAEVVPVPATEKVPPVVNGEAEVAPGSSEADPAPGNNQEPEVKKEEVEEVIVV